MFPPPRGRSAPSLALPVAHRRSGQSPHRDLVERSCPQRGAYAAGQGTADASFRATRESGPPGRVDWMCRYRRLTRSPRPRSPAALCPRAASAPRRCATPSSTSACRRCARATCRPSASTRWSRSTRCTRRSARAACSCSSRSSSPPRTSSASTRTSRRTRTPGSRTRARYVEMAIERFGLGPDSLVMEVASNDGYLLRHVVERGIPALGIEPAANVAAVAQELGIETIVRFFGRELRRRARRRGPARGPDRRQQRDGARAGPQRLRRRLRDGARATTAW